MVLRQGRKGREEVEGGLKQSELWEARVRLGPHWALSNPENPARVCYGQVTCPPSQVTCIQPSLPLSALAPLPLEPEDPGSGCHCSHTLRARITSPPSVRGLCVPPAPPHHRQSSGRAHLCLSTLHGAGAATEQLKWMGGLGAAALGLCPAPLGAWGWPSLGPCPP